MFNIRGKLSLNFCGKGFNPCDSNSALSCHHQSPKAQKTLRGEKIAHKQTQNNNSKKNRVHFSNLVVKNIPRNANVWSNFQKKIFS